MIYINNWMCSDNTLQYRSSIIGIFTFIDLYSRSAKNAGLFLMHFTVKQRQTQHMRCNAFTTWIQSIGNKRVDKIKRRFPHFYRFWWHLWCQAVTAACFCTKLPTDLLVNQQQAPPHTVRCFLLLYVYQSLSRSLWVVSSSFSLCLRWIFINWR